MSSKWVVITSIYPPRPRIMEFVDLGWNVVVIGDSKTDDEPWRNFRTKNIHYLSTVEQDDLYPEFSSQIGLRTYARKNIGYLYAAQNGAEQIFDTDDDTFIRKNARAFFTGEATLKHKIFSGEEYFNPYIFFTQESGLWPRGYPLRRVGVERFHQGLSSFVENLDQEIQSDILQTLVNLEPDVDSIFRMTVSDKPLDFPVTNEIFHIKKPTFTPANTQSTFWTKREKFKYLYVPRFVSFRFSDILKMYIAQHFSSIAYAGFLTEQFRNPHDYMLDFESEISCFMQTESVVDLLRTNKFESLGEVYVALAGIGVASQEEVALSKSFEGLMKAIVNE